MVIESFMLNILRLKVAKACPYNNTISCYLE